jgi:hypothetical protein
VIFPVPVTLNLFLALEFVLTLGICCSALNYTLEAFPNIQDSLWASSGNRLSGVSGEIGKGRKGRKIQLRIISGPKNLIQRDDKLMVHPLSLTS